MDVDEEIQLENKNIGIQDDFDLKIEDIPIDFNEEIFQDAQGVAENIHESDQNVQDNVD